MAATDYLILTDAITSAGVPEELDQPALLDLLQNHRTRLEAVRLLHRFELSAAIEVQHPVVLGNLPGDHGLIADIALQERQFRVHREAEYRLGPVDEVVQNGHLVALLEQHGGEQRADVTSPTGK